jgi:hypothetical protein
MRHILAGLLLLSLSAPALAQDVSLLAGAMRVDQNNDRSFAVGLGYAQRLSPYSAASAEYVNEGHPRLHHRDGLALQYWLHTAVEPGGMSYGIGAGPYYYFDTTTGNGSLSDYRNDHGLGTLVSLSARWHFAERSYAEARLAHIHGRKEHDSTLLMLGVGYELRELPHAIKEQNADPGENLLMVQVGRSIVNSFKSEKATAYGIEYRHTVSTNMEWSGTLMNEGRIGVAEREGVATQLWLLRPFTVHTVLELGVGGYVMRDQINRGDVNEDPKIHFAPIASIGIRWRLTPSVRTQLSWSRVITDYHRDSDVFLLGAGLVF